MLAAAAALVALAAAGRGLRGRHHRLPVLVGDACPRRQRRRGRRQGQGLERHAAELRRRAAEARRAVRRADRQEGRRHHHRHGQAGRGRRAVQGRQGQGHPGHHGAVRRRARTRCSTSRPTNTRSAPRPRSICSARSAIRATSSRARFDLNVASRIRGKVLDVVLAENQAVKELGKFSMARTQSWRDDVRAGMQALLLQNQGKINGIWASFDGQAYIIDDLLKAQGVKKGQIPLVSVDGGPESLRAHRRSRHRPSSRPSRSRSRRWASRPSTRSRRSSSRSSRRRRSRRGPYLFIGRRAGRQEQRQAVPEEVRTRTVMLGLPGLGNRALSS